MGLRGKSKARAVRYQPRSASGKLNTSLYFGSGRGARKMQNKLMQRPAPIVTLTTDFGCGDYYVGAMKGVILRIAPEVHIVDISHQIPPQDVLAAAFVLRHAAGEFPPGTVHVAVVDPGVGTQRRPLALQSSGHLWVGPDNGLFSFVLDRADSQVHSIARRDLGRLDPSNTFHGRDLFAPLAAHLCCGLDLAAVGPPVADPVRLAESAPCKSASRITGHIVHIDGFGNLVSNIAAADMAPWGFALRIGLGAHVLTQLCSTYEDVEPGAPLALIGSAGLLEIAVNRGHAARQLNVQRRAPLVVERL